MSDPRLEIPTFLVRHGDYVGRAGGLTEVGKQQAESAATQLTKLGLGSTALILSSNATRAIETARIIETKLACPMYSGGLIKEIGEHPRYTDGTLDDVLAYELAGFQEDGINPDGLIVVTHGPLIAAAQGKIKQPLSQVAPLGCVVEYNPGTWVNPREQLR